MSESQIRALLTERIETVEGRIQAACRRAGRKRTEVTLVAVTKTVAADVAALLPQLGILHLGESRPQELWHKAALVPEAVQWHLIGHLQRNKIERTLPLVQLIHSVDSVRLLDALEQEAAKQQRALPILLEVNASGEASKHGYSPEEVMNLCSRIMALERVGVLGLMTMAAFDKNPEHARPAFAAVRELRDEVRKAMGRAHALPHLSMGMSNDFEVAIEEGATLVRVGTALFEGLPGSAK